MKKFIVGLCLVVMLFGCAGFNANKVVTTASDLALALVLQNNPQYKPVALTVLQSAKTVLSGQGVTYAQLITELTKYIDNKDPKFAAYASIAALLLADFSTDTPIFTDLLPMSDSYKAGLIKRIDQYIAIASL